MVHLEGTRVEVQWPCVHGVRNCWSLRGVNFRRIFSRGLGRPGVPVRPVPGCEHNKLVEFSSAGFFIGPFVVSVADVQGDEEDRNDED